MKNPSLLTPTTIAPEPNPDKPESSDYDAYQAWQEGAFDLCKTQGKHWKDSIHRLVTLQKDGKYTMEDLIDAVIYFTGSLIEYEIAHRTETETTYEIWADGYYAAVGS